VLSQGDDRQPAPPQGVTLMASISIRGLPIWGNLYSYRQTFFNYLHRLGEICQHAWASPLFQGLVLGNFPASPPGSSRGPSS
jgi:hypothetical protein